MNTLRVSCIWVLYTLKIFVPVQNRGQYSRGQYSSGQYSRGQYLKHLRIALFFDLKGNSFVLHTKFRDPQFFWYPQIFFRCFLEFSQILLVPPDFFTPTFFFSNFFHPLFYPYFFLPPLFLDFLFSSHLFFTPTFLLSKFFHHTFFSPPLFCLLPFFVSPLLLDFPNFFFTATFFLPPLFSFPTFFTPMFLRVVEAECRSYWLLEDQYTLVKSTPICNIFCRKFVLVLNSTVLYFSIPTCGNFVR